MIRAVVIACGMALLTLPPVATCAESGWRSLTPDRSLQGWSVRGGKASFTVEGHEIVGRSVLDSPNSFLVTDATFADFILEYDAKVDPRLNSGVMMRAESAGRTTATALSLATRWRSTPARGRGAAVSTMSSGVSG